MFWGASWLFAVTSATLVLLLFSEKIAFAKDKPLPSGPEFSALDERPMSLEKWCAAKAPVCIHLSDKRDRPLMLSLLTDVENAFEELAFLFQMPMPLRDGQEGGDARFDVYLSSHFKQAQGVYLGHRWFDWSMDHSSKSTFLMVHPRWFELALRCEREQTLRASLIQASMEALDPNETPQIKRGFSYALAHRLAPCAPLREARMIRAQAAPWRPIIDEGNAEIVAQYLDEAKGESNGAIVPALMSMASEPKGIAIEQTDRPDQDAQVLPARMLNQTSLFDVLSATYHDWNLKLEELFVDVLRSRVIKAMHLPPIHYDWQISVSSLPRRLSVSHGIETTGMSFVRIDVDKVKPQSLELDVKWDLGTRFRWVVLKMNEQGDSLGEVSVPQLESTRELTIEVRHLEQTSYLVVGAVNLGELDHPWHPDAPPRKPYGYEIGIYQGK